SLQNPRLSQRPRRGGWNQPPAQLWLCHPPQYRLESDLRRGAPPVARSPPPQPLQPVLSGRRPDGAAAPCRRLPDRPTRGREHLRGRPIGARAEAGDHRAVAREVPVRQREPYHLRHRWTHGDVARQGVRGEGREALHPRAVGARDVNRRVMSQRRLPLSEYEGMWLFAMFDLPVVTKTDRRNYARFRKKLLEEGFMMLQFSVYAR